MAKQRLRINKALPPYKIGDVIRIDVDDEGIPTSRYWRGRLKDAVYDDCCTLLDTNPPGGDE